MIIILKIHKLNFEDKKKKKISKCKDTSWKYLKLGIERHRDKKKVYYENNYEM